MESSHRIYLLHLWPTQRDGLRRYRVILSDARTHEEQHFADIEGLVEFLREEEARLIKAPETEALLTDSTDNPIGSGGSRGDDENATA